VNARVDTRRAAVQLHAGGPQAPAGVPWPTSPQALVLAGGGNRCWWQAGLLSVLLREGAELPPDVFGTSAGAAIAAAAMSGGVATAMEACRRLYAGNQAVFRWRGLWSARFEFAHQRIYPAWIAAFVDAASLRRLQQGSSRLWVAVSRPAPLLGLWGSVWLGTLACVLEDQLWHRLHPRLAHWFGLRLEFLALNECATHADAARLLCAAAAPPPILPAQHLGGRPAFDGGYTDNAPIAHDLQVDASRSLTLLTRHYPRRALIFREGRRWYWQPSRPIPVSTWGCTGSTSVDDAFTLGARDACGWLAASRNGPHAIGLMERCRAQHQGE
jgi:predicted acylesterase/phospholipase RssA